MKMIDISEISEVLKDGRAVLAKDEFGKWRIAYHTADHGWEDDDYATVVPKEFAELPGEPSYR